MPMTSPSASTTGPPDDPGSSGAVCSIDPAMRRPRGPRNDASVAETSPNVTRSPRPPGFATPKTGLRRAPTPWLPHSTAGASPVSTSRTAMSPSASAAERLALAPSARRRTVTSWSPRQRLWAFVRTRPDATTTPDPADRDVRPRPPRSVRRAAATPRRLPGSPRSLSSVPPFGMFTCNLQSTTDIPGKMRTAGHGPLARAVERVGDRWTLLIVDALLTGPRRFSELGDEVERDRAEHPVDAAASSSSGTGIVLSRPYSRRPVRMAYELTGSGRELAGALRLLAHWALGHTSGGRGAAARRVRDADGGPLVLPHVLTRRRRARSRSRSTTSELRLRSPTTSPRAGAAAADRPFSGRKPLSSSSSLPTS